MMQLIRELAVYEKAADEVVVTLPQFIESGFGAHPVWKAWVAEINGEIQGMALYYLRYSTWKGKTMYLEDLVVNPQFRGKGIGTILMEALIKDAKEQGLVRINWQVLDWNDPAIHFYEKFKAYQDNQWINFHLNV